MDQKRVHGSVVHIDLKDAEVWIQHDGTFTGVANDPIERGVPEHALVLAFQHPSLRAAV